MFFGIWMIMHGSVFLSTSRGVRRKVPLTSILLSLNQMRVARLSRIRTDWIETVVLDMNHGDAHHVDCEDNTAS